MTRIRGGKDLTDLMLADLASLETIVEELSTIEDLIRDATRRTRSNPEYVEHQHRDMLRQLDSLRLLAQADLKSLRQRINSDLTAMLQRVARNHATAALPTEIDNLRQTVLQLTQRVTALEGALVQAKSRRPDVTR